MENIKQMLIDNPDNLNIFYQRRRLIILALFKANFNLRKACDLNHNEKHALSAYKKDLYKTYFLSLRKLREYQKQITNK